MINFTGLLKINNAGGNATYINTGKIEKIQGGDKKTIITYTSGLVDTFECSAHKFAKSFATSELASVREVDEIETPFTI